MQSAPGIYWACAACAGRTVALPILRKVIAEKRITDLWASARSAVPGAKSCPTCGHGMCEASTGGVRLDVCKVCQFVWFDAREFEQMPAASLPSRPAPLPQAAREAIALAEVERMREQESVEGPTEEWQQLPAIFGLPVECDTPSSTGYPAVTWSVSLVVLLVSIAAFMIGHDILHQFGFVPAAPWRYGGLTLVTAFFLHGGVLHLAGNLYFLLIFGDNVEDYLGRWRFGALLTAATLAGNLAHWAGDARDTIPVVGASGGISGIITFYALKYPHARLGMYLRAFYRLRWVRFPAWAGLCVWIVLQIFGAAQQVAGFTNVSALAHLGGAAVGLIAWLLWGLDRKPSSAGRA